MLYSTVSGWLYLELYHIMMWVKKVRNYVLMLEVVLEPDEIILSEKLGERKWYDGIIVGDRYGLLDGRSGIYGKFQISNEEIGELTTGMNLMSKLLG